MATVTDSKGRKITTKTLRISDQLRVVRILNDAAGNDVFRAFASLIYSVCDIDGVPFPPIANEQDIYACGDVLGNEGVDALMPRNGAAPAEAVDLDVVKN